MATEMENIKISWDEIHTLCQRLAYRIESYVKVDPRLKDRVLLVSRGGLIVGGIVLNKLPAGFFKEVGIINISTRHGNETPQGSFVSEDPVIVIDDMFDSMATARLVRQQFPNAYMMAVLTRWCTDEFEQHTNFAPRILEAENWVDFPWDLPANPPNVLSHLMPETNDPINPNHYRRMINGQPIQAIDVIEAFNLNFRRGNAAKYLLRAGEKDPKKEREDLQKCRWYIDREIEKLT